MTARPGPEPTAARAAGRTGPAGTMRWMLVLLPLTLLSVLLCSVSIRLADHQRETLLLLADTTAAMNRHSALEWEAIGTATVEDTFWTEVRGSRDALVDLQGALRRAQTTDTAGPGRWLPTRPARADAPTVASVATLLGEYLRATDEEFRLLRAGDREAARELDESRVDPLSDRLNRTTAQVRDARAVDAHRTVTLAVSLSVLTLLCSLVTVGVLGRQLRQNMRAARRHELERQQEREREDRDSLTGLWNRRALHRLFARCTAEGALSVLALDLNRLKAINDTGGHAAGDAHLRRVALALLEVSQPHGLAARWGGDEFVLLLPGQTVADAQRVAERASALLEVSGDPLPPFAYGAAHVPVATSLDRVLALADAAMYEHKDAQRVEIARRGQGVAGVTVEEFTSRLEALETPQAVLDEGLAMIRTLLDFHASVSLERVGDDFILQRLDGRVPDAARPAFEGRVYREGEGVTGQVIALGRTCWSNDYPAEPHALDAWEAGGLKSVVLAPVRHGGRTMGVVGLMTFGTWRVVTPQARRLLEALASRLGHTHERAQAVESVRSALQGGLLALGAALEERDLETAGHTERVVRLAGQLGARLGLGGAQLDALRQGASLHDIGKLVIPDAILLKPGPLGPAEWDVMRSHAQRGFDIAQRLSGVPAATLDVIRSHHERWDGTGYPDALRGEAIALSARIFAVCDVYDALTSVRPYKTAWSHDAAVDEICAQRGRQFDPQVVDAFVDLVAPERCVGPGTSSAARYPST